LTPGAGVPLSAFTTFLAASAFDGFTGGLRLLGAVWVDLETTGEELVLALLGAALDAGAFDDLGVTTLALAAGVLPFPLETAGFTLFASGLDAGADFLAGAPLFVLLCGRGLMIFLAGGLEAPEEGFTGFPEGFRDGEGLEIFFNGTRVMPMTRARKDRSSKLSGQAPLYGELEFVLGEAPVCSAPK